MDPLSALDTNTPSWLIAKELIMALCPEKFRRNFPSFASHFFKLSAAPEIKLWSYFDQSANEAKTREECFQLTIGDFARARTAFLWFVKVVITFPAAKSHSYIK
jgi:hypothetical protein